MPREREKRPRPGALNIPRAVGGPILRGGAGLGVPVGKGGEGARGEAGKGSRPGLAQPRSESGKSPRSDRNFPTAANRPRRSPRSGERLGGPVLCPPAPPRQPRAPPPVGPRPGREPGAGRNPPPPRPAPRRPGGGERGTGSWEAGAEKRLLAASRRSMAPAAAAEPSARRPRGSGPGPGGRRTARRPPVSAGWGGGRDPGVGGPTRIHGHGTGRKRAHQPRAQRSRGGMHNGHPRTRATHGHKRAPTDTRNTHRHSTWTHTCSLQTHTRVHTLTRMCGTLVCEPTHGHTHPCTARIRPQYPNLSTLCSSPGLLAGGEARSGALTQLIPVQDLV